jgi:hypothetical protein
LYLREQNCSQPQLEEPQFLKEFLQFQNMQPKSIMNIAVEVVVVAVLLVVVVVVVTCGFDGNVDCGKDDGIQLGDGGCSIDGSELWF